MNHISEVPLGVLRCRITFTIETPALDAHKVIPEFRARVTYPAEGTKEIAYHQLLLFRVASGYINSDA